MRPNSGTVDAWKEKKLVPIKLSKVLIISKYWVIALKLLFEKKNITLKTQSNILLFSNVKMEGEKLSSCKHQLKAI